MRLPQTSAFLLRKPNNPMSPKPSANIAQVEGSGTPVVNWIEPPND